MAKIAGSDETITPAASRSAASITFEMLRDISGWIGLDPRWYAPEATRDRTAMPHDPCPSGHCDAAHRCRLVATKIHSVQNRIDSACRVYRPTQSARGERRPWDVHH
jgi:hypothetical protein